MDKETLKNYLPDSVINEQEHKENSVSNSVKYFDITSIVITSLLASAIGGGVLIAINYERMGKSYALWLTLISTLVLSLVSFIIVFSILPDLIYTYLILHAIQVVLVWKFSQLLQGVKLEEHRNSGGEFSSIWAALGVGFLASFIVNFTIIQIGKY